ncbi:MULTISPECIES: NmrA family NAD(P)-binding protein [unclassified Cryobacterium]|uniref:NmrA family NAD(P)-binding protein n=1 Tax=unclassified Cryobacterium TaxID=2649013 RepID=UPI00106D737B|nr:MULTISPECIES: NmrA family NAD(P)-binding protein [unclassified Cryobacterium]TFC51103.1 NAD-dependent epimerase/dehydratase family protein [Cryobacterium sp. TMB3-1-2]TFC74449.1 NAD-dependent epimerase/dehydratase family protein [Cryobacterium sp. TMB3-15]TFC79962.1 NAD-dependent epimerase/dehydratase family protein [Cryobacterium sp. TMB3-10]TFD41863.1 NAD-dependent epimerase/dehydratase family protein [Cryobacterium sp. TMB3-12]
MQAREWKNPVLVTGATGNVGRVVVQELLDGGARVRATGRSVESVRRVFGDRVEAVALDFTDPTTWEAAFAGVQQMFLMRPPHLGKPKRQMIPALEYARDHGISQIVFLSLQGAGKNTIVPHAAIEAWLRDSGVAWTFVRASFFHQNLSTTHLTDIRDRDEIMVPARNGATAFVDVEDVGAVAAAALLDPSAHVNTAWTVTGNEALTYAQIAEILTHELGRPIRYARPGILRYIVHARRKLGMPWGMVLVTAAIYTTARLGLAAGLTDDVRQVLGRDPVGFAVFAHRDRSVWTPR